MPWKEVSRMEQRERMIQKWCSGMYRKSELAREFGVSRPTLDKWIYRYENDPIEGLKDQPPVPRTIPHRTDASVVAKIIERKGMHPNWGPRKLLKVLKKEDPDTRWPARATVGDILKAHQLVKSRRRHNPIPTWSISSLGIDTPAEAITADHKGQFRLRNGQYCYPLTLANLHSRFIYAVESVGSTKFIEAKPVFERVFREHGVPVWILTDNGGPFCCSIALCGLTRLSVWWIKLGIQPIRIMKASPWQNGIHERMHKTLKDETTRPPATTHGDQQIVFDDFREEFNHVRPHEALNDETPCTFYRPFARQYEALSEHVEYPRYFETRQVRSKGSIRWKGSEIFLSEALAGERIGLEEIDDGIWSLHFAHVTLARFDERNSILA